MRTYFGWEYSTCNICIYEALQWAYYDDKVLGLYCNVGIPTSQLEEIVNQQHHQLPSLDPLTSEYLGNGKSIVSLHAQACNSKLFLQPILLSYTAYRY